MAFSFNPEQTAQPGAPVSGGQTAGGIAPPVSTVPDTSLAVPNSPFLFMQQRGQEMSITAYVQIALIFVSILSVVVAVTLFAYSSYLNTSIDSKKQELLAADANFKEYPIEDMKRMSLRFAVLADILKNYVSVRSPLKLLEDVVEKQVVFQQYNLRRDPGSTGYIMNFNIVTNNYRVVIQQLAALNLAQYSKVVPTPPKVGVLSGDKQSASSDIIVSVATPVFVQGVLPDEIVFINVSTSTKQVIDNTSVSTTTP